MLTRGQAAQLRVLLVDDSPEFVRSALRTLALDAEVVVVGCATSGRQALEMVPDLEPDVVLMDLAMPEMNGLEATKRIKTLADPPRVVILTLYDDPAYREAAQAAGADAFVAKADWSRRMPSTIHAFEHRGWSGADAPDPPA
jgi:NarL family two-component system response regulator LiaR